MTDEILLTLVAAFFAGALRGLTGFGSSLVLAPVLAQLFDPGSAVALSLATGVVATLFMMPRYGRTADRSFVAPMVLTGTIGLLPGMLLLHYVEAETMRGVIGSVTLLTAVGLLLAPHLVFPSGFWARLLAGAVGGGAMGATSMGGPPIVLYLMGQKASPDVQKGNIVMTVGLIETVALALLTALSLYPLSALKLMLVIIGPFVIGAVVGRELFARRGELFRPLALVLLAATGLAALVL